VNQLSVESSTNIEANGFLVDLLLYCW